MAQKLNAARQDLLAKARAMHCDVKVENGFKSLQDSYRRVEDGFIESCCAAVDEMWHCK